MTTQAGQIKVVIGAEDRFSRVMAGLRRDLDSTRGSFGGLSTAAAGAGRALAFVGIGSAAAAVTVAASAVRQLANDLDALNDSSDATGSTIEKLSALEDVARRNGGNLDLVTSAIVKMNAALKDARPDSPTADALKRIGLSAEELRRLDPSEALQRIAVALNGYADDGDKARLVQELFGKSLREVAPLLKDVAEQGRLNATVTADQAREAEKFNKHLAALQTNISNVARGLVGDLLPALNKLFERTRNNGLMGFLGFDKIDEEQAALSRMQLGIAKTAAAYKLLEAMPGRGGKDDVELRALKDDLDKRVAAYADARAKFLRLTSGEAGGGRGFVNPELVKPSVGETPAGGNGAGSPSPKVSEAQRYLEALRRQIDATQELSALERLQVDIQAGRVDGLTPRLRTQLETEARRLDTIRAQNDAIGEQQRGLDDLIATASRRSTELDALLANTPTGRRAQLDASKERVIRFAEANPNDDAAQRQAAEAVAEINRQIADSEGRLLKLPEKVVPAWQQLADYWADTGKRMEDVGVGAMRGIEDAIDTLVDGGSVSFGRLTRSILADLARIQLKSWIFQALGLTSGGSGVGGFLSMLGSSYSGARAGGGPVYAGSTYLVGERGPERLVMGNQGGHVVPNNALGGTRVQINLAPNISIDARSDQGQIAQLVSGAMAQTQAAMWEQLRVRGLA